MYRDYITFVVIILILTRKNQIYKKYRLSVHFRGFVSQIRFVEAERAASSAR